MVGIQHKRIVAILGFISGGTVALTIAGTRVAFAVNPDIPRLQSAAAKGSIHEEVELGEAYLTGRGLARDEKQAVYWYKKAADSGDPAAQNQLGFLYQTGIGVEQNPARAARWYQRSAASGFPLGKVNLGVAFLRGSGVRKDPALAAQLFREAAERGSGLGADYLGLLYYSGIGVPKDASEALRWFEVGSKLHSARAKHNLALMLLKRTDRPSHVRAIDLLRESAAGGHVAAMHQLGLEITNDPGYARSSRENIDLLEQAASSGFWRSSIVLGVLAREGRGVPKDEKEAYYHFRVAVLQGGDPAVALVQNDIARLKTALGQEQTMALDLRAADWAQNHNEPIQFLNLHGGEQSYPAFAFECPEKDVRRGTLLSDPLADSIQSVGESFRHCGKGDEQERSVRPN